MGGSICVAIRDEEGNEYSVEAWTNMLTWLSCSPEFHDKGDVYQRMIAGKALGSVQWLSYGYVLYDFKDKYIVSCNGYFHPGHWTVFQPDNDDFKQVAEMHARGMIDAVYCGGMNSEDDYCDMHAGVPPKHPEKNLNTLLNWHKAPSERHFFIVRYKLDGWKIINFRESEDERVNVTQLAKYCKEHGWVLPVQGDPDAVDDDETYDDDDDDDDD